MSSFDAAAILLLAGIAVGSLSVIGIFWVREMFQHRARIERQEDARDLAMRVVLSLDDLVGACYYAAHDTPEIDLDEPTEFFFHKDDPVLLLPKEANWSLLSRELADEIRWLPNRLRNLIDALESIEIDPPDYKDLFQRRQDGYARLGLTTLDLVEKICGDFELPLPARPDYYNPRKDLLSKVREMEKFWKRRAVTAGQLPEGKSNVTPLFGREVPENHSS